MNLMRSRLDNILDLEEAFERKETSPKHWGNSFRVHKDKVVAFYKHLQKHRLEQMEKT